MRRRILPISLAAMLALSIGLVGCNQGKSTPSLTVFSTSGGNVSVMKAEAAGWMEAEVGMSLELGDVIKCGDDSGTQITFVDGSTIELQAGTEIEVALLDVTDAGCATLRLRQVIGTIILRVIKMIDPGCLYEVETPSAMVAVRGSAVQIYVIQDGTTWACNLGGDIWAIAQGVELQIPEGRCCVIRPGQEPKLICDLTITSTAGGSVTLPVEGTFPYDAYDEGTVVNLMAEPDEGYYFVCWTGDVDTVADVDAASTTITMNDDYSIIANFARQYNLAITSMEGGNVTTPGEGSHGYHEGEVVNLLAEADAGYRFLNWTGNVSTLADVEDASTNITMNGDYSITANFVAQYDLTISSTALGSVTTPGEGTFTYDQGTVVNLMATPATGCRFVNWTGDVGTVADVNAASTTITMNRDYSVRANFEVILSYTEITDLYGDVGIPGGAPPGTFSGWDMISLGLTYNPATDTMRICINVGTILGDADGDGDPGVTSAWLMAYGGLDMANLGSTEAAAVFFDLDQDGNYDVIAGISGSTDYYGFSVNVFSGPFFPPFNFGAPLPGNTGSISPNPSATNPDLEFTILNWSTLPGHDGSPGFCVGAFLGSMEDDGIGEDFVNGCI